ncbi:MAG: tetratricopeptide repeat protein, partial [Chloroflexi bacterium]|nr:tetratricopeptide repeat protein [Chloroflexota bacterium]
MDEQQQPDQTDSEQTDKKALPSDVPIHTQGDFVGGDKAEGDKVMGNKITHNTYYATPDQPAIAPEAENGLRVYEHGRYNLAANFTGRAQELRQLDDWMADDSRPMFVVVALGGTGKSALTWQWLESVKEAAKAAAEPPFKLFIWHGFYETGRIDDFLSDLLTFLGEKPTEIGNKRLQLNWLLQLLAATPALIVLDGAERLLRIYSGMLAAYQGDVVAEVPRARECVDPIAAELLIGLSQLNNGSKTLISSRLLPQELLGRGGNRLPARIGRLDLTGLDPDDALRFFSEWGIQTTRAEVDAVCAPLEYHPFCMALLAGYAAADFAAPNDLRAAAAYDPTADLLGRRQHILARAYDNLPPAAQLTLGRLAAFRAAVSWETIAATLGDNAKTRADLHLLERRGLLQRSHSPLATRPLATFDLHPIARRYAYNRLTDRTAVHAQLIIYFEAAPKAKKITSLTDLSPTIELYHHLTRAERYDEAFQILQERLVPEPMHFQFGAYQQMIELKRCLFPDGENKPPRLSDEWAQGWTLNALASSYGSLGRPEAAVPLFQQAVDMAEILGNKKNTAVSLGNLADDQTKIGALAQAADNLRRSIALSQEIEDRFEEAVGHGEYGRLLAYCGNWEKSAAELDTAQEEFDRIGSTNYVSVVRGYRALSSLLQGDNLTAQNAAEEALRLADEHRFGFPVERDYVRAHWLLGWVALAQGSVQGVAQVSAQEAAYQESQSRLDEALRRCRAINLVELEPGILLAHARLARTQAARSPVGAVREPPLQRPSIQKSLDYARQALTIAQRSGYVLNLAEIHNHLAQLALD